MDSREKVDLYDLIRFFEDAKDKFESRGEEDTAFVFEMMSEFFQKDYSSKKPLKFFGGAVGL
jgi:hypothetical protein